MPREELTSSSHSFVMPYLQTSCSEPPCAPTPGTRRKWLGTILRMSAKRSPCVAPTTYIICSLLPHSCDVSNTFSNRRLPPSSRSNWKSWEPALLVRASRITHFPGYFKKGTTPSLPMYGATVSASTSISSKKHLAYMAEVFPMSPRLASAMMNWSGWLVLMYSIVFSRAFHPSCRSTRRRPSWVYRQRNGALSRQ